MAKMDDRMELIGSAILGQAKQEARELIDKANAIRESEIASFKENVVNEMFDKIQTKSNNLRLRAVKGVSEGQLEAHRTLLLHRSEKTDEILDSVRGKLSDYAKTAKYKEYLLKLAGEMKDKYDHDHSVIMVSEQDLPLAEEIKKLLGAGTVQPDPAVKLGGFKLLNKKARILIDYTLDERLSEQKSWLLEHCGFQVVGN